MDISGKDELFKMVLKWLLNKDDKTATISGIQKEFHLGFVKARTMIEDMVNLGILSEELLDKETGKKSHKVLAEMKDFPELKTIKIVKPLKRTEEDYKNLKEAFEILYGISQSQPD